MAIDGVIRKQPDMSFLPPGTAHVAPVAGTAFVGLGRNVQTGGGIQAKTHIDAIIMNATLSIDGKKVVREGRLTI